MFSEAERVLQVEAETTSAPTANANIRKHYRLESVVDFICGLHATRIALQFPDHLLVDTPMVVSELQLMLKARANESRNEEGNAKADEGASSGCCQSQTSGAGVAPTPTAENPFTLFVLSDNTFGACCPDEITAAHYTAQCIVHFGYACMSRTNRLPVMYVAERGEYDADAAEAVVAATIAPSSDNGCCDDAEGSPSVIVVLSQPARYLRAQMEAVLSKHQAGSDESTNESSSSRLARSVLIADRPAEAEATNTDAWLIAGDAIPRLQADSSHCCQRFIFLGSADSPVLAQLAMICRYNDSVGKEGSDLQLVTPTTATETAAQKVMATNKALRMVDQRLQKRMYNIEVLKGSSSIGILVCTLAIKNYRESAEILAKLIRKSGKRAYIVYIGHINEYKIANFSDSIDAFVVISCPHSRQAQFPQKDDNFMRPLCSPIEALISLGFAEFDDPQAYTTGFAECCAKAAARAGLNTPEASGAPRITNSTAADVTQADNDAETSTALLVRGHGGAVAQFAQRTYKGLEARLGETEVQTSLVKGKDGIAKGYVAEKEAQSV